MRIIYCRICWMNLYRGLYNDTMINGGSYRDKFEIYNFMPHHGRYYGYVEPPGSGKSININNLDSSLSRDAESVDDVLVIWLATDPEEGGVRIVGWYKDATVFRNPQQVPEAEMELRDEKNRTLYFIIADNAFLLFPDQRTFILDEPGKKPGWSAIWYGDDETNIEVLNYIDSFEDYGDNNQSGVIEIKDENGSESYQRAARELDYLLDKNGHSDDYINPSIMLASRNTFKNLYNCERLQKYSGIEVWNKVWDHGSGGMIYALRNDIEYKKFGSAKSQDVAALPMHLTRGGDYYAGRNNEIVGQKRSLEYGEKFRNKFIQCVQYVQRTELETVNDFILLEDYLNKNLDGKGQQMWVHKYLHMFFPDKFSQFHSSKFKRDVLCALGVRPVESFYGMAGQLYEIKKRTKMDDFYAIADVVYANYPGVGRDEVYIIDALAGGVDIINQWEPSREIDVYTNLFSNLHDISRFQERTNVDEPRNHLYVVRYEEKLLGIIDSLKPKENSGYTDVRYGTWHCCFNDDDTLPQKDNRKGKNKPITDPDQLILIYKRYYENYSEVTDLERTIRDNSQRYSEAFSKLREEIISFMGAFPRNAAALQQRLYGSGISDFYKRLGELSALDGKDIDSELALVNYEDSYLSYWTGMIILGETDKDNEIVSIDIKNRILNIYYPERYVPIIDEDVLELVIDGIKLPIKEDASVWFKQNIIRDWIKSKFGDYTESAYEQNYIFFRGVYDWIGTPINEQHESPENAVYNVQLSVVEKKVRDEYETIEKKDEPIDEKIEESGEVEYKRIPQEKEYSEERDTTGKKIPKRDPQKRKNAMVLAGYKCEIDPNHATFISRNTGKPYVESHHLIPIEFHDDFKYSLDVEENIVCLCSNCHNEIHYGINNEALIRKLYSKRKELLHQVGLDVDENDLIYKAYRAKEQIDE